MAKKPTGADHDAPLTIEDEPGMAERFQRGLQRALNTPPRHRATKVSVKSLPTTTPISRSIATPLGLVQVCPGSEREGPARSGVTATSPTERSAGGACLPNWGKPGWCGLSGAVLEAPALVAGLDDLAVMGQPVEQRGHHLGVAEDARPFGERQIG